MNLIPESPVKPPSHFCELILRMQYAIRPDKDVLGARWNVVESPHNELCSRSTHWLPAQFASFLMSRAYMKFRGRVNRELKAVLGAYWSMHRPTEG